MAEQVTVSHVPSWKPRTEPVAGSTDVIVAVTVPAAVALNVWVTAPFRLTVPVRSR